MWRLYKVEILPNPCACRSCTWTAYPQVYDSAAQPVIRLGVVRDSGLEFRLNLLKDGLRKFSHKGLFDGGKTRSFLCCCGWQSGDFCPSRQIIDFDNDVTVSTCCHQEGEHNFYANMFRGSVFLLWQTWNARTYEISIVVRKSGPIVAVCYAMKGPLLTHVTRSRVVVADV